MLHTNQWLRYRHIAKFGDKQCMYYLEQSKTDSMTYQPLNTNELLKQTCAHDPVSHEALYRRM